MDIPLSHTLDVVQFSKHIEDAFDGFYHNENDGNYIGPYFVFVQSSGMDKTKIMREYQRACARADKRVVMEGKEDVTIHQNRKTNIHAKMVLCRPKKGDDKDSV